MSWDGAQIDRDALAALGRIATSFVCSDCRRKKPIRVYYRKSPKWDPRCLDCSRARKEANKPRGRFVNGIRIWEPMS